MAAPRTTYVVLVDSDAAITDMGRITDKSEREAILNAIDKLRQWGPQLVPPHAKSLSAETDLFELRPRQGRSAYLQPLGPGLHHPGGLQGRRIGSVGDHRPCQVSSRAISDSADNRTRIGSVSENATQSLTTAGALLARELNDDREFRAEWQRLAFARHVAVELIRHRAEHGLSQGALAERLGLSQPRIAKLESGEYNPRIETIIAITRKTGIEFAFDSAPAASPPKLLTNAGKEQVVEEHDGVVVRVASATGRRRTAA